METLRFRRGLIGSKNVEVIFTLRNVLTRVLAHLLLPTCLLELGLIWVLVPAWGLLVLPPFLILPLTNLLILRATGGLARRWKNCEATFQPDKIIVRLPGKNMFIMKPSTVTLLPDGTLEAKGSGATLKG